MMHSEFKAAEVDASNLKYLSNIYDIYRDNFNQPNSADPLGMAGFMKERWPQMQTALTQLGLESQFKRLFPTQESFYQSDMTLGQIYRTLKSMKPSLLGRIKTHLSR